MLGIAIMLTLTSQQVLVTGASGFLGNHLLKELAKCGCSENIKAVSSKEYNFIKWEDCMAATRGMHVVIHLAARCGGIGFNQRVPGKLFFENAMMGIQLLEASRLNGVKKFVNIGTICSYPKYTSIPFQEKDIWTGYPEETNAAYGLAKRMLIVQSEAYRQQYGFNSIHLLPVNMYGPQDKFDDASSHVIPAIIKKCLYALKRGDSSICVWGSGEATREFLFVKDAAKAIVLATQYYEDSDPINIGTGQEISIRQLVDKIMKLTNFNGDVVWDTSKPDGQPRRCLNVSAAKKHFGFKAEIDLDEGLQETIRWYKECEGW